MNEGASQKLKNVNPLVPGVHLKVTPTQTSLQLSATGLFKDTHREKALSNKTPAFTKSRNMCICVVGTSNQLFIRGS